MFDGNIEHSTLRIDLMLRRRRRNIETSERTRLEHRHLARLMGKFYFLTFHHFVVVLHVMRS